MQLWTLHSQLLVAIQYNDTTAAQAILQQGVDPDIRFHIGSHQMPAICLCAERGHYDLVKLLISFGCSINQMDDCGFTALHFACNHLFIDIVKLLIANRANTNATSNYGHTPLHQAVQQPSLGMHTFPYISCMKYTSIYCIHEGLFHTRAFIALHTREFIAYTRVYLHRLA